MVKQNIDVLERTYFSIPQDEKIKDFSTHLVLFLHDGIFIFIFFKSNKHKMKSNNIFTDMLCWRVCWWTKKDEQREEKMKKREAVGEKGKSAWTMNVKVFSILYYILLMHILYIFIYKYIFMQIYAREHIAFEYHFVEFIIMVKYVVKYSNRSVHECELQTTYIGCDW